MQARSQFLPACLRTCLLALTEEFSDARYGKYVLTTNAGCKTSVHSLYDNKHNYFHTVGFHIFSRCWSTLFTKVYSNADSSLKRKIITGRVGHEVGHGLPHVLSTSELASPSFSSPAVSLASKSSDFYFR